MKIPVIAIDGPAGSGKSTTARMVARELGWTYIDSGAFYRVASLLAIRLDVDLSTPEGIESLRESVANAQIDQRMIEDELSTWLDGEDVTEAIRSAPVTDLSTRVANDPALREIVNASVQRRAGTSPAVVDGRDIGTVVFPDAFLKIYLDASLEERARRRALQVEPEGADIDPGVLQEYASRLEERDRTDRSRSSGPLAMALDAVRIDTTDLDLPTQVSRILEIARQRYESRS